MKNAQFYLREKPLIEEMPILIRTTETASSQRLKLKNLYIFSIKIIINPGVAGFELLNFFLRRKLVLIIG